LKKKHDLSNLGNEPSHVSQKRLGTLSRTLGASIKPGDWQLRCLTPNPRYAGLAPATLETTVEVENEDDR